MKKITLVLLYIMLSFSVAFSQVRIKMQKEGGVYKIPCVVNGLKLKFIFDTGASTVSISLAEANLMLENGYLNKEDIVGVGKSRIADGTIVNNTKIILREIKINNLIFSNVEAVVINELQAPLLLGQSAIEKLGKIQIEGDEIVVLNAKGTNYSQEEIDKIFEQARKYYSEKLYFAAAELYQKLYDLEQLSDYGTSLLAKSYYRSNNYSKALVYFSEVIDKEFGSDENEKMYDKFIINISIGNCYLYLNDIDKALIFIQKSKPFMYDDDMRYLYYFTLTDVYRNKKVYFLLKENIYLALEYIAKSKGYAFNDIAAGKLKDVDVSRLLYIYALDIIDGGDRKEGIGMMIASAKYGYQAAIEFCEKININFGGSFK